VTTPIMQSVTAKSRFVADQLWRRPPPRFTGARRGQKPKEIQGN
jgi:hypothetical protein